MTPEAVNIPRYNPLQKLSVFPPDVKDVVGGNAVAIYDLATMPKLGRLYVQNLGTEPIKYALNNDATAAVFHGIISGGIATDDGTGGFVEFDTFNSLEPRPFINKISLFAANNFRFSVITYFIALLMLLLTIIIPQAQTGVAGGAVKNVGGFTLVTNLTIAVDTTAGGIVANDVLAPQLEITSAVKKTRGTGILKCVSYFTGDNNAPAFRLLICSQPITWPATNAVANLQVADFGYTLGVVDFTTAAFKLMGTNYIASVDSSIGITCATNSLFVYSICTGAITNTNSSRIKFTILQD